MAATCLNLTPTLSSSWITPKRTVSNWVSSPLLQQKIKYPNLKAGVFTALAVMEEREGGLVTDDGGVAEYEYDSRNDDDSDGGLDDKQEQSRPCELYVCNIPRSIDVPDLMEMFNPHGTVFSVEICRSPDTGLSRGCGYVTMGSMDAAKTAIAALDRSDVGGREMRVRFSVHMNPKRKNTEALNSSPVKNMVYESPHKLYVGNLARAVQPHVLRSHFSQFGTVASAKVLHDRKAGKNRAYGFLSFSSAAERDAAMSLNGTEFCGRRIVVRGLPETTYTAAKT
ncbi:hypothetical protein ACFX19_041681 [Malus domestica]|uniref:29 kDa ribonucleoprotein A, chloroplastic n=1 Tax=Malus domestica TaxID=3750 RepID=UPI0039767C27